MLKRPRDLRAGSGEGAGSDTGLAGQPAHRAALLFLLRALGADNFRARTRDTDRVGDGRVIVAVGIEPRPVLGVHRCGEGLSGDGGETLSWRGERGDAVLRGHADVVHGAMRPLQHVYEFLLLLANAL